MALLVSLSVVSVSLLAQRPDSHLTDSAANLFQRSAFAHGYQHGYEQGFHLADLDIQMGHLLPGVKAKSDRRDQDPQYRSNYGDKGLFVAGYKLGMRAGYADSLGGVPFRALDEMRLAANGLPSGSSKYFDRGVYEGFVNGERQGAKNALARIDLEVVSNTCMAQKAAVNPAESVPYCDGYVRGFQLGFSDGRAQFAASQKAVETAQKQ